MNAADPEIGALGALVSERIGIAHAGRLDRHLRHGLERAGRVLGAEGRSEILAALASLGWTEAPWQAVIEAVTVRETSFFRQRSWWESIAEEALRPLLAARRAAGTRRLRLLSIGCASGEEPYSLAILVERLLAGEPGWTVDIVGLDVCAAALQRAREGTFDLRSVREVEAGERARWFRSGPRRTVTIDAALRARVQFHPFNLAEAVAAMERGARPAVPGAPADLVMCRNVIIHLEPARQTAVARLLGEVATAGGVVAVSPVEANAAWFAPLRMTLAPHAILFTKERRTAPPRSVVPPPVAERPPALPPAAGAGRPMPGAATSDAARMGRVRHLADLGVFEEARWLCEHALSSANPERDLLMALVCAALGDADAAEAAARRAVAAAPLLPAAHYVLAIVCLRAGKAEQAREALADAMRLIGDVDDGVSLGQHIEVDAGQVRHAAKRLGVRDRRRTA